MTYYYVSSQKFNMADDPQWPPKIDHGGYHMAFFQFNETVPLFFS